MVLNPEFIAGVLGFVMSIVLEYFPGIKTWYDTQQKGIKALIALGLSALIGFAILGFNCAGWWPGKLPAIACSWIGVQDLLIMIGVAWLSSQATYLGVRYIGNKQ